MRDCPLEACGAIRSVDREWLLLFVRQGRAERHSAAGAERQSYCSLTGLCWGD